MVWFREVEYLRGFAALAVIAVHVSMNYTRIPDVNLLALLDVFVYIAAHFAVPVFIFISGWVLAARYVDDYPIANLYRRRARTILLPYLFFTALYLLVAVEGTFGFAGVPTPDAVAKALLLGTAAYNLWFFVLIIQLYLLYPLIVRGYDLFNRGGAALYLLLSLLFFQVLWNVGAHLLGAFAGTEWYTVLIRLFPSHLFYFVLGIHVARHTDRFRSVVRSLSPAGILAAAGGGALLLGGMWMASVLISGSLAGTSLAVFCVYRILEPFYYVPVIAVLVLAAWRLDGRGGPSGGCRPVVWGALLRDLPHPPPGHRRRCGRLVLPHRALVGRLADLPGDLRGGGRGELRGGAGVVGGPVCGVPGGGVAGAAGMSECRCPGRPNAGNPQFIDASRWHPGGIYECRPSFRPEKTEVCGKKLLNVANIFLKEAVDGFVVDIPVDMNQTVPEPGHPLKTN
ncbi:MAG: Acyltransferase 3 [Methanoculleus marisnigri]|uniref:Acyltransferase 3 n=1 Tax=Methanoculleus marisnigri TaxID=2198 RepID=A0A117MIA1_9EURY|nr:MAG: Acyltransferase 3 [Methanoculleus marisnigri]